MKKMMTTNDQAHKLFCAMLGLLLRSGMKPTELTACFHSFMENISKMRGYVAGSGNGMSGTDFVAGDAIKAWNFNPRYLTKKALPRPLPLYGKAPSVESLVRGLRAGVNVKALVEVLRSAKLIKLVEDEKYLPAGEYAVLSRPDPLTVEHVFRSILTLIETIDSNMAAPDRTPRLIERFARVPDLDPKQARAFARFTHQQGLVYLQAVDDWLEARRLRAPAGDTGQQASLGAGVHVYAYLGLSGDEGVSPGGPALRGAGSSPRSSLAARCGSTRAAAPCTTSGAVS